MKWNLRSETPGDYRAVEELTREAFWDVYVPGCTEHYFLHQMRAHPGFLPALSTVAVLDGQLVGHIAYSKAAVISDTAEHEVISFGPLSVAPACQKSGVGSALVLHTLELAAEQGYRAVVILGDPRYYHRFGFRSAEKWDITDCDGKFSPAMMAYPLYSGALDGVTGAFHEPEVFEDFDAAEFAAFDAAFPPKEHQKRDSQRDFAFLSALKF